MYYLLIGPLLQGDLSGQPDCISVPEQVLCMQEASLQPLPPRRSNCPNMKIPFLHSIGDRWIELPQWRGWGTWCLYWGLVLFQSFSWLNLSCVYRLLLQKLSKLSGTSLPWTLCTGTYFPHCSALGTVYSQFEVPWNFLFHLSFRCNKEETLAELLPRGLFWDVSFSIHC